ncbi:MAG: hypothetical protein NT092_13535 [Bacteroidia bacterium]|nr:hypothetical protein [Bacteroidia bacterium]
MLLSVLQICFIPGFIFLTLLDRKSNDSKVLSLPVFSFALSLIINYLIVLFLSYFNLYTRGALIILLVIEFIILTGVFVYRRQRNYLDNSGGMFNDSIYEIKSLFNDRLKSAYNFIKLGLFLVSVLLLIYLLIVLILNIGKIFNAWDAVFSWNRWAIDFYNNKLPSSTYHYPQLVPANWSISYVLCGYPLQFVPKAIMPLFLIFQVYSFIILGLKQKSTLYFSSVIFLFLGFNRLNWTDGCVDVPVAFFSILVYICLCLLNKDDQEADKKKYILLSTLFVCGAAVTKQAGIFVVLIYPLLLFILTKNKFIWTNKKILWFGLSFIALIIVIILPYYIYAEMAIRAGLDASEIHYVTNEIYNGASYFERLFNAGILFSDIFSSKLVFIIFIFPFLFSFTDRTFRLLNICFVIPYTLIWALFFSYSLRNAAIVIPYFCLGIGIGVDIILMRIIKPSIINESLEK